MSVTISGPLKIGGPGGNSAAFNVTAAAVIKALQGILNKVACVTTGGLTLYDANAIVANQTITAITVAAGAVVTISTVAATNPFAIGDNIGFAGVGGMTQIIPATGLVTAIGGASGAWTITTDIDSTNFTAFTSGGTASTTNPSNLIGTLAMTQGVAPFQLDWPCKYGILVSAVSAGIFNITFT